MDDKIHVYSSGFLHCSVCAPNDMSIDDITTGINNLNDSGLVHGWQLSSNNFADGTDNPHVCENEDTQLHYLFEC